MTTMVKVDSTTQAMVILASRLRRVSAVFSRVSIVVSVIIFIRMALEIGLY